MAVTATTIDLYWEAATDNVAVTGYKIYFADGTLIQDVGNVLSYTVTGLTPETEYSFKHSAYDANGNESTIIQNIATATTLEQPPYLFSDTFDGNVLNPVGKWVLTNPDSGNVIFVQNDLLNITTTGNLITGGAFDNNYRGTNGIILDSIAAFSFDIRLNAPLTTYRNWYCGITFDSVISASTNRIELTQNTVADNQFNINVRENSTSNIKVQSLSIKTITTFKFVITSTTIDVFYYNSGWVLLENYSHNFNMSASWYPFIASRCYTSQPLNLDLYNFYITDYDFNTQYP